MFSFKKLAKLVDFVIVRFSMKIETNKKRLTSRDYHCFISVGMMTEILTSNSALLNR